MTDEEVKKWLNEIIEQDIDFEGMGEDDVDKAKEALKISIKLLEEKENTISITERITIQKENMQKIVDEIRDEITCKDCISREAVIERINKQRKGLNPNVFPQDKIGDGVYEICIDFIKRIPSVMSKKKVGKWLIVLNDYEHYICNQCGKWINKQEANNYCPNCGAKMEVDEDDNEDA